MPPEVDIYRPDPGDASAARISRWVAEAFGLPDQARVAVAEMRCPDRTCPFAFTVVAIRDRDTSSPRQFGLHVPLDVVSREDVLALARQVSRPACGLTGRTLPAPSSRPACGA